VRAVAPLAIAIAACGGQSASAVQSGLGGQVSGGLGGVPGCQTATPAPTIALPFTPCGGEPSGTWWLEYADPSSVPVRSGGQLVGTCPSELEDSGTAMMQLVLADGGAAQIDYQAPYSDRRFAKSCPEALGAVDCGPSGCVEYCGVCECFTSGGLAMSQAATWARSGSQLTISDRFFGSLTFDYCVSNGHLILSSDSAQLTLKPVDVGGRPVPCDARTAAQCEDETGCFLNPSAPTPTCTGEVIRSCQIADYGDVAGCDVFERGARCAGVARPCEEYSNSACVGVQGCTVDGACKGTPPACNTYSLAECLYHPGCVIDGNLANL